MIEKLLTEELVDVKVKASNWEEAVMPAGKILLKNKKIEERYIQAMIETVKDMGPYIVMAPGIAMPHGRPSCGVNEIGVAVISLESPVEFGSEEFDPVKVIIAICSKENKAHIDMLQDLTYILNDEELIEKVDSCNNKKELLNLILDSYKNNK